MKRTVSAMLVILMLVMSLPSISFAQTTEVVNTENNKISEFSNDFENSEYITPAAEIKQYYQKPDSTTSISYISNADSYGGYAKQNGIIFEGDMYADQYVEGVLQKPLDNIYTKEGNKYTKIIETNMRTGGLNGYVGFGSRNDLKSRVHGTGTEALNDMVVVPSPDAANNHVLHLNPMEYLGANTEEGSYFGKINLDVANKTTVFETKLKVVTEGNGIRLNLVKDGYLNRFEAEPNRWKDYSGSVNAIQSLKNSGLAAWYDAVTIINGNIYLGKASADNLIVSNYSSSWLTLRYYLDWTDISNPKNVLVIIDENGVQIGYRKEDIIITEANDKSDNPNISSQITTPFVFDSLAEYSYVISAVSTKTYASTSSVYIDDISFRAKSIIEPEALVSSAYFVNNFESEEYYKTTPNLTEYYQKADSTTTFKYINNADAYKGLASESAIIFQGDMYANQYVEGVLQKPTANAHSVSNNKYANTIIDNQRIGGLSGYTGFNSKYVLKSIIRANEVPDQLDMTVRETGDGNHALCFQPVNAESTALGYSSYFGKAVLDVKNKVTEFETRMRIDKDSEAIRLHIIRNYDELEGPNGRITSIWNSNKYGNVSTMQYLKQGSNEAWYDAITLKGGKIYLGKENLANEVGSYTVGNGTTAGEWFTVKYILDLTDLSTPKNVVVIKDANGKVVYIKSAGIVIDDTTGYTSNAQIASVIKPGVANTDFKFGFNADASYGLMISSATTGNNGDFGTAYVDDLKFSEFSANDIELLGSMIVNGNTANFKSYITNNTGIDQGGAKLVAAVYDAYDNSLLGLNYVDVVVGVDSLFKEEPINVVFDAGESTNIRSKLFLISDFDTIKPLVYAFEINNN